MNPKDIMTDAIHNFHPQYQQYTQYSSGMMYFYKLYIACVCSFIFVKLFGLWQYNLKFCMLVFFFLDLNTICLYIYIYIITPLF